MILFRYLTREVLLSMFAVSSVLLLIIMSGRFVKYLSQAASGQLSPDVLFAVMGFRLPGFLELILPLGLFIAILLAYGRLYMDSEMTVMSACGMSNKRLVAYTLFPAFILALVVAGLSLFVSPLGMERAQSILLSQKNRSEFDLLTPTRFMATQGGSSVTYIKDFSDDRQIMNQVFMAEMDVSDESGQPQLSVILADWGEQVVDKESGQRYLRLHNGHRYSGRPGDMEYQVMSFEGYSQLLLNQPSRSQRQLKADSIPTMQLLGSDVPKEVAALHWRVSLPVLVLVVALLAVPLSKTNPRQGRYVQMIPAILLYIVYLVSLNAARGSVEDGESVLALWAVHGLFLSIALILLTVPSLKLRFQAALARREQASFVPTGATRSSQQTTRKPRA